MTLREQAEKLEAANLKAERQAIRAVSSLYRAMSFRDLTALLANALDSPNSLTRIKRLDRLTLAADAALSALTAPPDALASLIPDVVTHTYGAAAGMLESGGVSAGFGLTPTAELAYTEGASLRLQTFWGANQRRLADDVQKTLLEALDRGQGVRQAAALLRERVAVSRYRSELIVANELGNASAQVSRDTMVDAGVTSFVWRSAADSRVRPEHRLRNGRRYLWSDPPDGETPGSPVRCRCIALPVFE